MWLVTGVNSSRVRRMLLKQERAWLPGGGGRHAERSLQRPALGSFPTRLHVFAAHSLVAGQAVW